MTAVDVQISTRFHAACARLQHALTTIDYDKALIEWRFIHRLLDQRQADTNAQ
jgi:hypothetical protein